MNDRNIILLAVFLGIILAFCLAALWFVTSCLIDILPVSRVCYL